jgi:2-alkenal reductase
MRKVKIIVVCVVLLFVAMACTISSTEGLLSTKASEATVTTASMIPTPTRNLTPVVTGDLNELDAALTGLYARVNPGVVCIQTMTADGGALGSGFVYDTEGHIITNYHVVEGAESVEVDFPSGIKVYGEVIATDGDTDLAIIKVDTDPSNLFPLTLGDSDALQVGQTVIAIGNPFGLNGTMTMGIVSAKGRVLSSIRDVPGSTGGKYSAGDIIQTDALINPGNSGGPLLNLNGEVIGINRAIETTGVTVSGSAISTGIGYATSINLIKRVVPNLISKGYYDYPYLGITPVDELNLTQMEALGITYPNGAYVLQAVAGGPAAKAGIRGGTTETTISGLLAGGDLIIAADDIPVYNFSQLISYMMNNKSVGDTMKLTIVRDNKQMEVTVTLEKRP